MTGRHKGQRGARRHSAPAADFSRGRWFLSGLASGIGLCFALYLVTLPGDPATNEKPEPAAIGENQAKPRFHFYELLPEQRLELGVEPAEEPAKGSASAGSAGAGGKETYLLQAGSFRQLEDADRRRAELLLMGLEPHVEETTGDRGRWFRVYLGPFESRSKLARARSLTTEQGIDTLLLKRAQP